MKLTTFSITHQIADFLRLIGMRDRLRCPACGAVGTWKPHGGWLDWEDERKVRRWLCKWCGHYIDKNDERFATIGKTSWEIWADSDVEIPDTPLRRCRGAKPWRG